MVFLVIVTAESVLKKGRTELLISIPLFKLNVGIQFLITLLSINKLDCETASIPAELDAPPK